MAEGAPKETNKETKQKGYLAELGGMIKDKVVGAAKFKETRATYGSEGFRKETAENMAKVMESYGKVAEKTLELAYNTLLIPLAPVVNFVKWMSGDYNDGKKFGFFKDFLFSIPLEALKFKPVRSVVGIVDAIAKAGLKTVDAGAKAATATKSLYE